MTSTNHIDNVASAFILHSTVSTMTFDRTTQTFTATVHELDDFEVTVSIDNEGIIRERSVDSTGFEMTAEYKTLEEYITWMIEG